MTFTKKAEISRVALLIGIALLIAIYLTTHIIKGQDILLRCVVSTLPIVILIPGILARRYRSGSLLCFVLMIYFLVESEAMFKPGNLMVDIAAMSLVVFLFTISMFYARWQQRANVLEGGNTHE